MMLFKDIQIQLIDTPPLSEEYVEPELFDLPNLIEAMKGEGVATLVLESDLGRGDVGRLATRLEAFVEMIS